MANASILAAFERMWQHVATVLSGKADKTEVTNITNGTTTVAKATSATSAAKATSVVGEQTNDILATATALSSDGVYFYRLGGSNYANINDLPTANSRYSSATVLKRGTGVTLLLWGNDASTKSFQKFYNGSTWGDWIEIIDSNTNVGWQGTGTGAEIFCDKETNTTSANYCQVAGRYNTAAGSACRVDGVNNTGLSYQNVLGHYNNTTTATAGSATGTGTGTAFVIGNGTSGSRANAFRVNYAGTIYAVSTIQATGRDYAEYFEWQDLNLDAEDRRGYFVTLDGDKIKIAEPNDYILGIVSGQPSVIGNGDEDWRGRYILDEFGAFILEEFEYEEEVIDKETGETKTVTKIGTKYKENPNYDPTLDYIQREDRPEWDAVGMLGVLSVRDDGTCKVNGYCNVAEGGIATSSETGYRVIKRINDNIVEVIFR